MGRKARCCSKPQEKEAFETTPVNLNSLQCKVKEITPCEYVDLTQRHVEPLLVRYASHHGFNVRFSTELVAVEPITGGQQRGGFLCTVHDHITKQTFQIHTKYLFGADGGRSTVARSMDFKFLSRPGA